MPVCDDNSSSSLRMDELKQHKQFLTFGTDLLTYICFFRHTSSLRFNGLQGNKQKLRKGSSESNTLKSNLSFHKLKSNTKILCTASQYQHRQVEI